MLEVQCYRVNRFLFVAEHNGNQICEPDSFTGIRYTTSTMTANRINIIIAMVLFLMFEGGFQKMGTNYYLFTKDENIAHECFAVTGKYGIVDKEYTVVDEPQLGYWIHLNKCSCGWRPLFQCHKAFRMFSELESFFIEHKGKLRIYDEYMSEFKWRDYKQVIIEHATRDREPVKWVYDEDPIMNNGRKYLRTVSCKPEEAEIWTPFDHLEYARKEQEAAVRFHCRCDSVARRDLYSHSDDTYPIDWVNEEFC